MTNSRSEVSNAELYYLNNKKFFPADRLEGLVGKKRSDWIVDDLVKVVKSLEIRLISLMHIGGDGWLKTLDFAPMNEEHLRNVLTYGERADGSSLFKGMGIPTSASDVILLPRIESAFLNPFSEIPTMVLLCGHLGRDGKVLPESPDTIVRSAYDRALKETGVELHALGEVEFFLGKRPDINDVYGQTDRGYHATAPFVFGENLRREALAILAEMGVPIKYGHSEVGFIEADEDNEYIWEQHEVELSLLPLPEAAEAVVLTMWVLRNLSHVYGMQCQFDPIVKMGHAGSGMHFHCSPVDAGKHCGGMDNGGELFDCGKWLIGGLSRVGGALMAFGNRVEGSFIRLSQGKEAPNTVTWGQFNRKSLIRLPLVTKNAKGENVSIPTIEFRLPDGSAHPHLLLAGISQALIAGRDIEDLDVLLNKTSADNAQKNPDEVTSVPSTFNEVAGELSKYRDVFEAGNIFPGHVIDRMVESLKGETNFVL